MYELNSRADVDTSQESKVICYFHSFHDTAILSITD